MAKANNTVFVIQGTGTERTILRTYEVSEEVKTPLRAAKDFLGAIAADPTHPLHAAYQQGQLSYASCHPVVAEVKLVPRVA